MQLIRVNNTPETLKDNITSSMTAIASKHLVFKLPAIPFKEFGF